MFCLFNTNPTQNVLIPTAFFSFSYQHTFYAQGSRDGFVKACSDMRVWEYLRDWQLSLVWADVEWAWLPSPDLQALIMKYYWQAWVQIPNQIPTQVLLVLQVKIQIPRTKNMSSTFFLVKRVYLKIKTNNNEKIAEYCCQLALSKQRICQYEAKTTSHSPLNFWRHFTPTSIWTDHRAALKLYVTRCLSILTASLEVLYSSGDWDETIRRRRWSNSDDDRA